MRNAIHAAAMAALFSVSLSPGPGAAEEVKLVSEAPALQARAVQLRVHSERMDRDYVIEVTAPFRAPVLPGQKAPVIYALDGGYGIAGPSGWLLGGGGAMSPAYVVAISYPPGQPNTREADLLFRAARRPDGTVANGGKAAAFTAFLLEDLKPFIQARFPVDEQRSVLFGHSLSAAFTANVLADRPGAFAGYLIASPSVWADPTLPQRLAALQPGISAPRVFLAYGEREDDYMVEGGKQVAAALATAPSRLQLKTQVFPGEAHVTYYPALMSAAFPFLLPRQAPLEHPTAIALSPEQLRRYEGLYAVPGGPAIMVSRRGGGLLAQVGDMPSVPLSARAQDSFFVQGLDVRADFSADRDEPSNLLTVYANGDKIQARRVP